MLRLACFSPLRPVQSGIARYTSELLPVLAIDDEIDVFVDGQPDQFVSPDGRVRLFDAHDFVWNTLAPTI